MMINKILENKLKQTMGLNLKAIGSSTLTNAISRRMRSLEINDEEEYYKFIRTKKSELNELIDEIAINETWFFRDTFPFTALQRYARNWFKNGADTPMRLLSVPCSTGEEPYSMAISLLEAGINEQLFSIEAIDISNRALAVAKKGIYSKRSFRGSKQIIQKQYFNRIKSGYAVSNKIKNLVRFRQGNLLNIKAPLPGAKYDVIFCRNLLIYLDKINQQEAIATLDALLTSDGLIFTGHAEPGVFPDSKFIPLTYPKAFALSKKPAASAKHAAHHNPEKKISKFQLTPTASPVLEPHDLNEIQLLAEDGHYEKAIMLCDKHLKENGPTPQLFFLMGLIFDEMDNSRQAIKMLKKTIYLDPNCLEAIKMLTVIYKRQGDKTNYQVFKQRIQRVSMRLAAERSC